VDGGVQLCGDFGGRPFPGQVQVPQQRRIQVLAVLPAELDRNPGGLQPAEGRVSQGGVR